MKHTIEMLKKQIEAEFVEQSKMDLTPNGLAMNEELAKTWLHLDDIWMRLDHYHKPPVSGDAEPECDCPMLTQAEAEAWNAKMHNVDGTKGGHWTMDQTNELAKSMCVEFTHISPWCWNVTCNMMYSDYYNVAGYFNCNTPRFYGELAKAFLFDPDVMCGPKGKIAAYYHAIAAK